VDSGAQVEELGVAHYDRGVLRTSVRCSGSSLPPSLNGMMWVSPDRTGWPAAVS
jgi:hypothetical protein